jgi:hypothetical protein
MNFLKIYFGFILAILCNTIIAQDSIPKANLQIVSYVESVIGKKVDRGECWDLANEALKLVKGKWDYQFKYGKLLDPNKDVIFPGDIIQFKNVKVITKSADGRETKTETMLQHTAIVYKVHEKGDYELAHQNTAFSGRKVGTSRLVLKNIKRGKIWIYRPIVED